MTRVGLVISGAALAFLVVASAAAGRDVAGSTVSVGRAGTGTPVLQPLTKRCFNQPDGNAKPFWFHAKDGALLDGAVLGQGRVGVLLTNDSENDLCSWLSYALQLSRQGYLVLLFDIRGSGLSPIPRSQSLGRPDRAGASAMTGFCVVTFFTKRLPSWHPFLASLLGLKPLLSLSVLPATLKSASGEGKSSNVPPHRGGSTGFT